jgi:hypothetical protein
MSFPVLEKLKNRYLDPAYERVYSFIEADMRKLK